MLLSSQMGQANGRDGAKAVAASLGRKLPLAARLNERRFSGYAEQQAMTEIGRLSDEAQTVETVGPLRRAGRPVPDSLTKAARALSDCKTTLLMK